MNFKTLAAGIAVALAVSAGGAGTAQAAMNLVTNGGFETGDFTGWTTNEVSYPQYIVTTPVQEGTYAAQIAGFEYDPDTLSQVITTTIGQYYRLSFWYFQDEATPNGLGVTWNGANIFSATDELVAGYQNVIADVLGSGSDALVFSAYNDPAFTYLDNVSVAAVPEPGTWTMIILGFGMLGATVRRRRQRAATAAA
jgi:hypothetical protein